MSSRGVRSIERMNRRAGAAALLASPRLVRAMVATSLIAISLFVLSSRGKHVTAAQPPSGDWPMWGGTPDRNMVSSMTGLPTSWDVGKKQNVKWIASLGSQTYGNPVVAD